MSKILSRVVCFLFFFTIILTSCGERERTNPLDPLNPNTSGQPDPPQLISKQDTVIVSWSVPNIQNITSYNIYRRIEGEVSFNLIGTVNARLFVFYDTNCELNRERWYKISVRSDSAESLLSDHSQIRPGSTYLWALDQLNGQLIKFTHDGRHQIKLSSRLLQPFEIAYDGFSKTMWIGDTWVGGAEKYDLNANFLNRTISLSGIADFAIDGEDDSIWAVAFSSGTLVRYSLFGLKELEVSNFNGPWRVSLDTENNHVYIIDQLNRELIRLNYEGSMQSKTSAIKSGWDVNYDQARHTLWVADSSSVWLFKQTATNFNNATEISGFGFASQVELNRTTGDAWISDWSADEGGSSVKHFSKDGVLLNNYTGFTDVRSLAVDPTNNYCFIGEGQPGRIIAINPAMDAVEVVTERNANFSDLYVQSLFE